MRAKTAHAVTASWDICMSRSCPSLPAAARGCQSLPRLRPIQFRSRSSLMTDLKPRRVMVVDDDSDIRASVRDLLEDEGYEVVTAIDGKDAIEQLARGPLPAVILLDLMMPRMDGWQFVAQQREMPALAGVPVVVVSADVSEQKARALSVSGFVRKPFNVEALLTVVLKFFE